MRCYSAVIREWVSSSPPVRQSRFACRSRRCPVPGRWRHAPHLDVPGNHRGEEPRLLDAVVEADTAVAVAAEEQPGVVLHALLDPGDAVQVSQVILRDGAVPAHDMMEDGCRCDA